MSPFENLAKVLAQEQAKGFANKVAIGGLEKFVRNWGQRSTSESDAAQNELIAQLVASLSGYDQASIESRQAMLARAVVLVQSAPAPSPRRPRSDSRSRKASEPGVSSPPRSAPAAAPAAPRARAAARTKPGPADELVDE